MNRNILQLIHQDCDIIWLEANQVLTPLPLELYKTPE